MNRPNQAGNRAHMSESEREDAKDNGRSRERSRAGVEWQEAAVTGVCGYRAQLDCSSSVEYEYFTTMRKPYQNAVRMDGPKLLTSIVHGESSGVL